MKDDALTAKETLLAYFQALTIGEMVSIRSFAGSDFYIRVEPKGSATEARAFEDALERYLHLTEDTEGFQIKHEALAVSEDGTTAWFEGKQMWEVEWDGKVNRVRVGVSGVLEHDGISWKLEQLHASPGDS